MSRAKSNVRPAAPVAGPEPTVAPAGDGTPETPAGAPGEAQVDVPPAPDQGTENSDPSDVQGADLGPAPDGDGSDQDPGAGDAPGGDAEALAAARAEALAKLVAGDLAHDEDDDGEPLDGDGAGVPAPPRTGVVREWGGDVPHLVCSFLFHFKPGGVGDYTDTAYAGDVVLIPEGAAPWAVEQGSIKVLDED